ncbi:hypothetical protein PPYR_07158 [Photinus pyralis]|uniref:Uncharacterized protein n=1 Tax=Photinus pyralis TaxID=7054 RepID=A0A1Y1NKR8_PHOPY|nr:uncharacterized protein LOC116168379 [Photinus pyralis]KAB0799278.1 hypothetical protein PPYR_07158 [Photinus pyralis]
MSLTGDPNQGNKPGFPYQPSPLDFPRFNENSPSINPLLSPSGIPSSSLYLANDVTPFKNYSFYVPPSNYSLPSTSSSNGFSFSPQIPVSIECSTSVPHCFSYQPLNVPMSSFDKIGSFGGKRKTQSPSNVPLKQHITEERMAEHMSRLHISSQTPNSTETLPTRERRLYMCEEMQRLQTESIIPAQILDKVYRPCTALVPWTPPIVPPISKENNNNEEEPDNNHMDMDS